MITERVNVSEIKLNDDNPRTIKDVNFKKLVKSIREFPEMLELRPVVVDENNVILGGNMRFRAICEAGIQEITIVRADQLNEDQKREFIVKDNVGYGEWDWDILANEWDTEKLVEWGLDIPKMTETERLSELKFQDIYYEPESKPTLKLSDCVDLEKYNIKLEVINKAKLTPDQKEVLKMFAYRFIKIDFEQVANYYFFNASKEEKSVIERLRLVLCDAGIDGFIQDDLIRVHQLIIDWND
jgi:hypothetical protein